MARTISFISDLKWFSLAATRGKYESVQDALVAHIKYITRKGQNTYTYNLHTESWIKYCNMALTRNSRARTAAKIVFALPNDLRAEDALPFIKEFVTSLRDVFKVQVWDAGKKRNVSKYIQLSDSDVGIAIHDDPPAGGERNLHAHILLNARPAAGGALKLDRAELRRMHTRWREYLTAKGYEVLVNSDPSTKQHHIGPSRLRSRDERIKEEAMKELEFLSESYRALRQAREEEEKYIAEIQAIQEKQKLQYEREQRIRNLNAVALRLASRIKTDLFGIISLIILLSILLRKQALTKECKRFQRQVEEKIKNLNTQFNISASQGDLKNARECVKELLRLKNRVARERREIETELAKAIPLDRVAAALGIEVKNLKIKQDSNGRWLWFDPRNKQGGTNIDLVMQTKNLTFQEAVKWILDSNNDYLEKLKEEAMKPIKLEELKSDEIQFLKERYGLGPASWVWSRAQFRRHPDGRPEPVWLKPKNTHITLHGGTEGEGVPARCLVVADHPLHCAFLAASLPFPEYAVLGLSLNGVPVEFGGELEEVLSKLIQKGLVNKNTKVVLAAGDEGAGSSLEDVLRRFDLEPWENFSGWVNGTTHLFEFQDRLRARAQQLEEQAAQQAAQQQGQEYVDQYGQQVAEEHEQHWDFMPRPGGRR